MTAFGFIWIGLVVASFFTFVIVISVLGQSKKAAGNEATAPTWSVSGWILATILGLGIWAFVCAALLGFGFSHGSLGIGGLVADLLLFGGPALYIFTGYRVTEAVRAATPAPDSS